MPQIVPYVLGSWVALACLLFACLPPRRGAAVVLVFGWLFLPTARYPDEVAGIEFPYWVMPACLPASPYFTKALVIGLSCLTGVCLFDPRALLRLRPRWVDLPIVVPILVGLGVALLCGMVNGIAVAYVVAAVPAALAALCYAILSSAMPRAGGSYVYATRALDPFLGFLGAFAQWFGLSMGMGVVAYLFVPMVRDMVATAGFADLAPVFDRGDVRLPLALAAIWVFWAINRSGVKAYERTVVVMAVAMIVGPVIMTAVGFATLFSTIRTVPPFSATR